MAYKNYKIRDNWLDIDKYNDVDIQSVDGVISTVKVNGEDYGGGGSSDFSTAKVTIVSANQGKVGTMFYGMMSPYYAYTASAFAFGNGVTEIPIILYQGQIFFNTDEATLTIASTSGAIAYDSAEAKYTITGDCTITIS